MSKRRKTPRLHCPAKLERLRQRCLAPIESFFAEGHVTNTPDGSYIFQDNGASVLAVAHLDTVRHDRHFGIVKSNPDTLYNCQLDDRLGAWIALDELPRRGIAVDVLLTTGEECCRSTAKHFQPGKEYNWLVGFDRGGLDVVTYHYESREWLDALEYAGNDVGWGSYSDIAEMDHLDVQGVNWGIGYHDYHGQGAYCKIGELGRAVDRFVAFHAEYHGERFGTPSILELEEWEERGEYSNDYGAEFDRTQEEEWREYLAEFADV